MENVEASKTGRSAGEKDDVGMEFFLQIKSNIWKSQRTRIFAIPAMLRAEKNSRRKDANNGSFWAKYALEATYCGWMRKKKFKRDNCVAKLRSTYLYYFLLPTRRILN